MGETSTITIDRITIDRMMKEDLDQVLAIEQTSFTMPWTRNLFLSEFRNAPVSLMLAARSSLETKAVIGGFSIIDVPSREAALEWAAKIAVACRCAQEVREIMFDPES